MSNALEQASLIMVPSGYEDGTLGSLKPTDGSGDFTFTRCDGAAQCDLAATRVNADGYIEKGYENLLLQSNSFDTTWTPINSSIPISGQAGYDGLNNAWLLQNDNNSGFINQDISNSGVSVFSVYAKSGNVNSIRVRADYSSIATTYFDLENGTIGDQFNVIESKITSVGNGWYRCSITYNGTTTRVRLYPAVNATTTGVAGDNIYIQDAMLNQGMVAYPYVETTTAPVAGGILEDMPRLDYSGSCPALLLEPQRTNLFTQSEYFGDSSWAKFNCTILTNTTSTLSPTGYYSASKIQENTATNSHGFGSANTQSNSGEQITFSAFIKAAERSWATLRLYNGTTSIFAYYNLTDGTLGDIDAGGNATIVSIGNGWYRCSLTITMNSSSANYPYIFIATENGVAIYEGTNGSGIYVYGLQFEQDATYPTSYIPTYGVSQTRLGDDAIVQNVASLLSESEGTLYLEVKSFPEQKSLFAISDGTISNRISLYYQNGVDLRCNIRINNSQTNLIGGGNISDGFYKIAVTYDNATGLLKMFVNGILINSVSYSGGITSTLNTIDFAQGNSASNALGLYKQALVFPTALSDEECIALTTIS